MPINIKKPSSKSVIQVVTRVDSALGEGADYQAYLDSFEPGKERGNEELLKLSEEPTRLVLKVSLSYDDLIEIKDRQFRIEKGQNNFRMSSILEELRFCLIDVINPPGVAPEDALIFVKDASGKADKELIILLDQAKVANDLIGARLNAQSNSEALKKSRSSSRAPEHSGSEAGQSL